MPTPMQTPRFLKAKTPSLLEKLMFQNNLNRRSWHQYQIIFDGKLWYAWFYVDVGGIADKEVEEVLKEE